MKLAYLAYPYTDDPEKRTKEVLALAQKIIEKNPDLVLLIPHIAVDTPKIRDAIMKYHGHKGFAKWDLAIIQRCDMLIVGHPPLDYTTSSGCVWEAAFAELNDIEVMDVRELL